MLGAALLATIGLVLGAARPSSGAAPETDYVVQAGDTLWEIAVEHYASDPRKAVWEIQERNDLASPSIVVGQVLVLPALE